jgi:hypothetical protein
MNLFIKRILNGTRFEPKRQPVVEKAEKPMTLAEAADEQRINELARRAAGDAKVSYRHDLD